LSTQIYRALLVDDDALDLEGLRAMMDWSSLRIQVTHLASATQAALKILKTGQIDLLISDISMPGMTGLDLCARGKEYNPHMGVIYVSCHANFAFAQRALDEGALGYMLKPIDESEFESVLRDAVARLDAEADARLSFVGTLTNHHDDLSNTTDYERKVIQDVKRMVADGIERAITLKEIANKLGFTPNYLGHMFQAITGEFFSDYLTRYRLERARLLLKDPFLKIYEIADRLGYTNISHFNRVFKAHFGKRPGDWRDQGSGP
jgi:two-component system response regulator YesN